MSGLLGAPALLEDRSLNLVAYGTQDGPVDQVQTQSILLRRCSDDARRWLFEQGISTSEGAIRTMANPRLGLATRLCVPACHDRVTYGYFWFLADEIGDELLHDAERIAARAGERLARDQRLGQRLEHLVRGLIHAREAERRTRAEQFAHAASIPLDGMYVVVKLRLPTVDTADQFAATSLGSGMWSARVDETDIAVLVRSAGLGKAAQPYALADRLRQAVNGLGTRTAETPAEMPVSIGGVGDSLLTVPDSWTQAGIALSSGPTPARVEGILDWEELGVGRLRGLVDNESLRKALAVPEVEELLADPRSTVLSETALTYLDCGTSAKETAQRLHIHRQTLYYRLSAIEQQTGLSFSNGRDRLLLHLAITLLA